MLITTRAILLRAVRHGDRTVVVNLWTAHAGLRSALVRAGGRRGAAAAMLQALGRLEVVLDEHPERDMHQVREMRVERPYRHLHHDPVRAAVALFVQEVLYRVLRTDGADPGLTAFLYEALDVLDEADELAHYPVVFLLNLAGHLGFRPVAPAAGEDRFDPVEGHFVQGGARHGHTLDPELSSALAALLGVPLTEMDALAVPARLRRPLLDHLLLYYRIHLEGLGDLRSPTMLHQALGRSPARP
ncbi:MAG: DNA repair protein RecO C-terminal domain-containing protein [Flavobacteriales bacterium]|jgi:DNA repair protein RecO (recombination protein O)|nr:DNA repair protein RecO C-terminal domain-containing protein [Flavobacteriales bacterium]